MGRPNRQAERRQDIFSAAIAVIERHDLATLTLTEVADELGLTPNAVRYYFKDVETLILELALRSNVRFYDNRRVAAARFQDPRDQLSRVIADGLPTGPEDAEWRVIWRAFLSAGFELDQRPVIQQIFHLQVGLYLDVLTSDEAQRVFSLSVPAQDIALTIMSMEDYLGYRVVARDPAINRTAAIRLIHSYAQLAVGTDLPWPTSGDSDTETGPQPSRHETHGRAAHLQ